MGIPVSTGRFGSVVAGGINPAAVISEKVCNIEYRTLTELQAYSRLCPSQEINNDRRC